MTKSQWREMITNVSDQNLIIKSHKYCPFKSSITIYNGKFISRKPCGLRWEEISKFDPSIF